MIENIVVSGITGLFGSFGSIAGNDNSEVKNIVLRSINIKLREPFQNAEHPPELAVSRSVENVVVKRAAFPLHAQGFNRSSWRSCTSPAAIWDRYCN